MAENMTDQTKNKFEAATEKLNLEDQNSEEQNHENQNRRKVLLIGAVGALLFLFLANVVIGTFSKDYYNYWILSGEAFGSSAIGEVADLEYVELAYDGEVWQIKDQNACQDLSNFLSALESEAAENPTVALTAKFYYKNHNVKVVTLPTFTNTTGAAFDAIYDGDVVADFLSLTN